MNDLLWDVTARLDESQDDLEQAPGEMEEKSKEVNKFADKNEVWIVSWCDTSLTWAVLRTSLQKTSSP